MKKQTKEIIRAQEAFCKKRGVPMLIPHDGICIGCKKDITTDTTEIDIDIAQTKLIIICPHCFKSFCD